MDFDGRDFPDKRQNIFPENERYLMNFEHVQ